MSDRARAGARKVLVTGGAGFIGSHVADGYLARGDRVWVVDDLSRGKRANVPVGATFVQLSIEDADGLGRLCEEVRFDLVNHHAAQIDVRVSVSDPARDARTNVLGLLNVIEAARRGGVTRFVYVSSGGVVYGEPEHRPTPERAPKLPLSPYGVTKLTGEHYLRFYREIQGIEYAALRYSNVYGPRQDPHGEAGVVAIFCNRLLAGKTITVFGDGEQTRDYVHVADVVAANLLVSDARLTPGASLDDVAFNVGTGIETSVNRLADLLVSASGLDHGRVHEEARPGELRHSSLDASRLHALGWKPRTSLEAGLKDTFDWIAAERRTGTLAGA
jgi:UDP-glucose 4-epimerase